MKKISLYTMAGLMLFGMASCSDDYTDWASPQTNPQEDAITIPGFQAAGLNSVIDLNGTTADSVNVFTLSGAALPEGYSLTNVRMDVLQDGKTLYTVASDEQGRVATADLQTTVTKEFGKRPAERAFTANVYANATKDGEAVLINAGAITPKVIPAAPFIDETYYLLNNDGTTTTFTHSSKDVYEDSIFSVVIKTNADNQEWQITTKTNVDAGNLTAEGRTGLLGPAAGSETALNGSLTTSSPAKGRLGEAGVYRITIDMWNYTYSIEKLNFLPYIYEIGANTNWSGVCPLAGPAFDGKYKGFAYLDGEFKFKPNADNWDGDYEKVTGNAYEGTLDANGAGNIDAPEPGFYMMDVDLGAMTYKNTLISSIGIIGDATPDGWNSDVDMTYDKADNSWNATVTLTDGSIKFRANDGWDINWGGSLDNLSMNADNINVKAGTYAIKLIVKCEGMNTCTMTKK